MGLPCVLLWLSISWTIAVGGSGFLPRVVKFSMLRTTDFIGVNCNHEHVLSILSSAHRWVWIWTEDLEISFADLIQCTKNGALYSRRLASIAESVRCWSRLLCLVRRELMCNWLGMYRRQHSMTVCTHGIWSYVSSVKQIGLSQPSNCICIHWA